MGDFSVKPIITFIRVPRNIWNMLVGTSHLIRATVFDRIPWLWESIRLETKSPCLDGREQMSRLVVYEVILWPHLCHIYSHSKLGPAELMSCSHNMSSLQHGTHFLDKPPKPLVITCQTIWNQENFSWPEFLCQYWVNNSLFVFPIIWHVRYACKNAKLIN